MNGPPDPAERARLRAEAQFTKERDGAQAKAEHDARAQAVDEKTARLKALRLAKQTDEPASAGAKRKRGSALE